MNALMRTTVAFTQMSGSTASNVIPPSAHMVSNIRLNPEDTVESAKAYIAKTIGDENVTLEVVNGQNPSRISRTDCEGWNKEARPHRRPRAEGGHPRGIRRSRCRGR